MPVSRSASPRTRLLRAAAPVAVTVEHGHPRLGAIPPAWRKEAVVFLAGAFAVELACVRRYERHHLAALALSSPVIAAEFRNLGREVAGHADRIAGRIVQLGGVPDWSRDPPRRGRADSARDLHAMIRFNLDAVLVAIKSYSTFIPRIVGEDALTLRLIEDIRNDKRRHADELGGWLAA